MQINLARAVEEFQKVGFYQPLFECITNSIEAHATEITIELSLDRQVLCEEICPLNITEIKITDNGDGFTDKNRDSFSIYYSDFKKNLGCKGIGRLSWLKVFTNVDIESYTGTEKVIIPFTENFTDEKIKKASSKNPKKTVITFKNTREIFTHEAKYSGLESLKTIILKELTIKFFLLYKQKKALEITLKEGVESIKITSADLPELKYKEFNILPSDSNEPIVFKLYYDFPHGDKHEHWLCADERKVKEIDKGIVSQVMPEKNTSSYFLLCSEYLDKQVCQERIEFQKGFISDKPSLDSPLTLSSLLNQLKVEIGGILLENFPGLEETNKKVLEECFTEYPYLKKYFETENNIIIDRKKIIEDAKKSFDQEKEKVKRDYAKMLENKKISSELFFEKAKKVSEVASRELAEYILYRDQIIEGLQQHRIASPDSEFRSENFMHNLFMPMGKFENIDNEKPSLRDLNLWLLDDKYMGFHSAFSDKTIKKINEEILRIRQEDKQHGDKYEPDLVMFYSKHSGQNDLVVIELKKSNASSDNKVGALNELSRNIGHILSKHVSIRRVYGYIIAEFDEQTINDIKMQPGVKQLFTQGTPPYFYLYNDNIKDKNNNSVDCHIYMLSLEAIIADAKARNSTFLEILTSYQTEN